MIGNISVSNVLNFSPSSLDDGTNRIYSASWCAGLREFCLPSPSSQSVSLFGDSYSSPLKLFSQLPVFTPDLAIHSPSGEIILGCRESVNLAKISKERDFISIVDLGIDNFFAASFKYNQIGDLFVGNVLGDPVVITGDDVISLNLKTNRSYDCVWLDNDNLLVSCMSDGRIILCSRDGNTFHIKQELSITQPYRFSPVLDGLVLLTTRGWIDRPGLVFVLDIHHSDESGFFVSINSTITIPDNLFFVQKRFPRFLLEFFKLKPYTGYINDVAWISQDEFMVTTKTGGSLLVFGLNGILKARYSKFRSIFTRFAGDRLPGQDLFVVDAGITPSLLRVTYSE